MGSEWKEGVAKSWLCFWDEMSPVLGNKKHAEINGFITQSQDFYHELYETKAKLRIRPFVIGGTTTEVEFLSENPSLRRFNVVKMEALDRANFERDVDAIWASAYADALANPTMQEVSTFAAIEARNKEFISPSDYETIIEKLVVHQFETLGYVQKAAVVEAAIAAKIPIPHGFGSSIECYLKNNGFKAHRPYNADGKRIRAWIRK
jgi:predicted P-loop ATPase